MAFRITTALAGLFFSLASVHAAPEWQWVRPMPSTGNNFVIAAAPFDQVYAAYLDQSSSSCRAQEIRWDGRFGRVLNINVGEGFKPVAMQFDDEMNFFLVCVSPQNVTSVAKISWNGSQIWRQTYFNISAYQMVLRDNGNFLLAGSTPSNAAHVGEYDSFGVAQWAVAPWGSAPVYARSVSVSASGQCFIGGAFQGRFNLGAPADAWGMTDGFVAQVNSALFWRWIESTSVNDACIGVAATHDGGVAAAFTSSIPNYQTSIAKLLDGRVVWRTAPMPGAYNDLQSDLFGNIYTAGAVPVVNNAGIARQEGFVASYDRAGNLRWRLNAGGQEADALQKIVPAPGNTFYVLGTSQSIARFGELTMTNPPPPSLTTFVARITNSPPFSRVTTIAGSGQAGHVDSANPLAAMFWNPDGGGVRDDGVIFIGDALNHAVRYITPAGVVGTWTGKAGEAGYVEGAGAEAKFNLPLGVAIDGAGDLLIADYGNNRIRKAAGSGDRRSFLAAGSGNPGLSNGPAQAADLRNPNDMVEGPGGEIFFTEFANHTVRRITRDGQVRTVAGTGSAGFRDGDGAQAQFNGPAGIAIHAGALYITDWANNRIRKITLGATLESPVVVSTFAGTGQPGMRNGIRTNATFAAPNGITADRSGNIYVTEYSNNVIRQIDSLGWVVTIAGSGALGFADGPGTTARFFRPGGICLHPDGSLIVADTENHRIRRVVVNGKTNAWPTASGLLTIELRPTLKIYGAPGERYRIESRENFDSSNWTPVETVTIEASPRVWTDSRPSLFGSRMYRSIKE